MTLWKSITLITLLPIGVTLASDVLKANDKLPTFTLFDQHDKTAIIGDETKRLIFASDNTAASMITAFLDNHDASWLTTNKSVYLADIHKMPSFVAKMFALPQLREKPYQIILGREAADMAMLPRQKGCVAIMPVNTQTITSIDFACSEEELKAKLQ